MHHLRLAILGESPCHLCYAACCKQNGHEFAVLLEDDERRRFAAFSIEVPIRKDAATVIERVIPYRNGRCIFLDTDDRCTIYDDRPQNCRRFQCVGYYHLGGSDVTRHGQFLERNPRVAEILSGF